MIRSNFEAPRDADEQPTFLARIALAMTDWTERWVPDAFIFALIATVIVVIAGFSFDQHMCIVVSAAVILHQCYPLLKSGLGKMALRN